MARKYYFYYYSILTGYKTAADEAKDIGGAFARCVYDTLLEYGGPLSIYAGGPQECIIYPPYENTVKYKAYINGRLLGALPPGDGDIEISLESWNRLLVDFKFDPLFPECSNDELMTVIKTKAVEKRLLTKNAKMYAVKR